MPNRLGDETSPYLLQHRDNPVDWYPWGPEALRRAREDQKPIFLSIGYAACHWCHVMAHESFEDPETAQILNTHFISIKVDREERPDLDDIYMQAVTTLTGRGGWPLSAFLTPEGKPFYGGTYFPPEPRYGMPSFKQVLLSVQDAWVNKRAGVEKNSQILTQAIRDNQDIQKTPSRDSLIPERVISDLSTAYDWQDGGWGSAPKFPQPLVLTFLLQQGLAGNEKAADMAIHNLEQISRGGLYDLVGGGFHRYSTDAHWLVPHFEKMLYDNAQLALAFLEGYSLVGKTAFRDVVVDTLTFLQREMSGPEGGFYASLDADSPGGEGRYYTWRMDELREHLTTDQVSLLQQRMRLTDRGNFEEGLNVLQLTDSLPALAHQTGKDEKTLQEETRVIFATLARARDNREPPMADDKIITAWNALAIQAFALAGLLLEREDFSQRAAVGGRFLLQHLQDVPGRLRRTWRAGKAHQPGTLADYALTIQALASLYQTDFDPAWYQAMKAFLDTLQQEFAGEGALFYDSAAEVDDLILRPQRLTDQPTPSGNAAAAWAMLLMGHLNDDPALLSRADEMVSSAAPRIMRSPSHFGFWLTTAGRLSQGIREIALVSPGNRSTLEPFLRPYRRTWRPCSLLAARFAGVGPMADLPGLLQNRKAVNDQPTAFVCENFTCQAPVTDPEDFAEQLSA